MTTTRGRTLDHVAGVYDFFQPLVMLWREDAMNALLAAELALEPQHRVLDVGCGTGKLTALLGASLDPERGGGIVGIDAAPRMIAVAGRKRAGAAVSFQTAVAESLPFPDAAFDRACSALFFHHVDYELKVAALGELRRVLRPGGRLAILDVDTPTTWFGGLSIRLGEWLFRQPEIGENRRGLLRQAFAAAGCLGWQAVAQWQGYITLFVWQKRE